MSVSFQLNSPAVWISFSEALLRILRTNRFAFKGAYGNLKYVASVHRNKKAYHRYSRSDYCRHNCTKRVAEGMRPYYCLEAHLSMGDGPSGNIPRCLYRIIEAGHPYTSVTYVAYFTSC